MVMITAQLVIEANNEGPGGKLLTVYLDLGAEGTRKQGQIHLIRKRSACVYTRSQAKSLLCYLWMMTIDGEVLTHTFAFSHSEMFTHTTS